MSGWGFAWGAFQVFCSGGCVMAAAVRFGEGDHQRAAVNVFFALMMLALGVGRLKGEV